MKKVLCFLLLISMTGYIFAGGKSEGDLSKVKRESYVNEYGWLVPEETLTISYFDARDSYNSTKISKNMELLNEFLLEEFNVEIKKLVDDLNPKERLNMMLAAGDYPDVIAGLDGDARTKWIEQKRIIELTPYMDTVGNDIKSIVGDTYGFYLNDNKQLWAIPNGFGADAYPYYTATYRLDLYKEMGSPKIETTDEYFEFLKALVKKYPVNSKNEKTYALSWHEKMQLNLVSGFWGLKDGYQEDIDHNLTHWLNTEQGLKMVKYLNRFYREGLLDPDSFINKQEDWEIKMNNQRVFGHLGAWYEVMFFVGHSIWKNVLPEWQEEMRFIPFSIKDENAEAAYTAPKNILGWEERTVITDKCKNPEDVMRFINFLTTPAGLRIASWGVPNRPDSLWFYNGQDGSWSFNENQVQKVIDGTYNKEIADDLGAEMLFLAIPMSPFPDDNTSVCWFEQNFPEADRWMALLYEYTSDTVFDNTARSVVFESDNPMLVIKTRVEDGIKSGFAKAVMSETEKKCEESFNKLQSDMNAIGLHDLEKFLTSEYKSKLILMGR